MRLLAGRTIPEMRTITSEERKVASGELRVKSCNAQPFTTYLSLSLLMLGSLADDAAHDLAPAVATENETAVFADRFDGGADFHAAGGGGTGT